MRPTNNHPADRSGERGIALVLAIFFTMIVVGLATTGALILRSHQTRTRVTFVAHGQSLQFAKSGLIEALGWMRKQTSQPVTTFEPQLDTVAVPPVLDTIDPNIGIVREFQITNSIWGRYELWRQWDTDPDPARLAWRQQMQCEDISAQRGNLSPGSVWRLRSLGYVFMRVDTTKAFDQAPNQVVGRQMAEVEVRRLALQPPGQAALCVRTGSSATIGQRGRVLGGSVAAGIYHLNGTGSPSVSGTLAEASGTPNISAATTYEDSFQDVFGVSQEELQAMSDYVVSSPTTFPSPVPVDTVVTCTVPMTFNASRQLSGTGVVAIIGDVTIEAGSYSSFSGLLYVVGNLTMHEPSQIQGAVVVTGTVSVIGASDFATIQYDDTILQHLRQELGTYRLSSAMARPMSRDR